jgi:hypothetical protein
MILHSILSNVLIIALGGCCSVQCSRLVIVRAICWCRSRSEACVIAASALHMQVRCSRLDVRLRSATAVVATACCSLTVVLLLFLHDDGTDCKGSEANTS